MSSSGGQTLIVGDVHGCADEFSRILEISGYHKNMRLVLVGDLIHKGPDSLGVLRLTESLGAEAVMGNHELGFLRYLAKGGSFHAGFEQVRQQLGSECAKWADYLRSLPLFIETEDWMVVHAGLEPGRHPSETSAKILTRIRTWDGKGERLERPGDPPWFDLYRGKQLVVFGHWARRGLVIRPNAIGLDTGCVYGQQLSAVLLPQRKIFQVPAKRVYQVPET